MIDQKQLSDRLRVALQKLIASGGLEFREQGHNLTGAGINSLEVRVERVGLGDVKGQIWGFDYMVKVDTGLRPGQLPPRSVHVQELRGWIKRRGIEGYDKKALSIASRMDRAHRKYGIPPPGAYKWTKNGRRTGWIKFGIEPNFEKAFARFEILDLITEEITQAYGQG